MATGLATRCSACGTVFRVVPDQLRVSEGWVRCGRCAQVFNALEALVDLESGLPQRAAGAGLAPPVADRREGQEEAEYDIAQPAAKPGRPELPPPPSSAAAHVLSPSTSPSREPSFASAVAHTEQPERAHFDAMNAGPESAAASRVTPSFVKNADRAARWRRPRVRAALAAVAGLSLLGLAAQIGHTYRDLLAARAPQTRPWLELACAQLGCTVEAARAIESLAVESSGLVRVEKSNLYKLQVSLRNRSGIELAVPALEVTLTDFQGRLIARKVLRLAELGTPQVTIAAGRELAVQATLQAAAAGAAEAESAPLAIAGYTIELFYP